MKFIGYLLVFSFVVFSFVPYSFAGKSDIRADIVKSRSLEERRKTPVIIRLEHKDGFPVLPAELEVVHSEKIHLLIVDPALSDYHYKTPLPMRVAGDYIFTMTPYTPCGYKVWADIDSVNSDQQFVVANIAGAAAKAEECRDQKNDRGLNMISEKGNYRFSLEFDTGVLKAGQNTEVKLVVRNRKGVYINDLQPIMGGYAHVVGFYDDFETIERLYSLGEAPMAHYDRGGPILKFNVKPTRAGYLKLFARLKINDIIVSADFGVEVKDDGIVSDEIAEGWVNKLVQNTRKAEP